MLHKSLFVLQKQRNKIFLDFLVVLLIHLIVSIILYSLRCEVFICLKSFKILHQDRLILNYLFQILFLSSLCCGYFFQKINGATSHSI
nr:MAG TPA: hypothetical protein [Bacteriophage sp.]